MTTTLPAKDYSYTSGERQTATRIQDIRADHSGRYQLAVALLEQQFAGRTEPLAGLDLFCGNGYGTWLASNVLGAHVLGIDGSEEAIAAANRHYATPRTVYAQKCFPFDVQREAFDFVTCFESIEHVADAEGLFTKLAESLKPGGVLFVSTPNEAVMPFAQNAKWFRHHVRHFTREDMAAFASNRSDLLLAGHLGQKVYRLDERGRVLGVDESLDMMPSQDCETAHFLIHVYLKKTPAGGTLAVTEPEAAAMSEGCDAFTPGIVDPGLLQRAELKLDVGCGEAGPQPGFVGVDIRALRGVGILSEAYGIDRFLESATVAEFYSRHTLEHLTYAQVRKTFASWFGLLRPGGRVHILVPDLEFHIAQFLDPNTKGPSPANRQWTQRQHALAGFYGWQREADHKLWDVHKCGFTAEIMGELLMEAGFCGYRRLSNKPWHLDVEAFKPI